MKPFFRPALLLSLLLLEGAPLACLRAQPAPAPAKASTPLVRRISLPGLQAPLEMVLREVTRRAGVGLAYSATRLPMHAEVTVAAQHDQPLGDVLTAVLRGQPVAFGLLDGQVVLWRQTEAPPVGVIAYQAAGKAPPSGALKVAAPPRRIVAARSSNSATVGTARRPDYHRSARGVAGAPPGTESVAVQRPPALGQTLPRASAISGSATEQTRGRVGPPAAQASVTGGRAAPTNNSTDPPERRRASQRAFSASTGASESTDAIEANEFLLPQAVGLVIVTDSLSVRPTPEPLRLGKPAPKPWRQQVAQVSLVPPLGSNWVHNSQTVNRFSLNLLIGYAAGVRGAEVGGLLNLVRDTVAGVQVAGLANATGGPVLGAQVAGLVNVASGSVEGVQSAGLVNIASGPTQGWQNAGLLNVAHTRRETTTEAAHATADPLVQVAGLINAAPRGLKGAQIAGLINSAGYVKGVQIAGLLNVADSVVGVSLAPLNFVRRGYHALELVTDTQLPFRVALKLGGSPEFYTTFVWAIDPSAAHRWGLGYGIGAELASRNRLSYSVDVQGVQINEDDNTFRTWATPLNMHTQLRTLMGWATGPRKRLRLLVGPTVNLFISQRLDPETGELGSGMVSQGAALLTDIDYQGRTYLRGWIEANIGVRWRF